MKSKNSQKKLEVELRAPVSSDIYDKFSETKYQTFEEQDQYFSYTADQDRSWIIRIRNRNQSFFITFKSKKDFGEGSWYEVDIPLFAEKASRMKDFLLGNGFFIDVDIVKMRKSFKAGRMEINIDTIEGLGMFIEAEILAEESEVEEAKEKIRNFFIKLGIPENVITEKGYVSLMREKNGTKS